MNYLHTLQLSWREKIGSEDYYFCITHGQLTIR